MASNWLKSFFTGYREHQISKTNSSDVVISKAIDAGIVASATASHVDPILFNAQKPNSPDYGYSVNNPICTSSLAGTEQYLSQLCTKSGQQFTWSSCTSIRSDCHGQLNIGIDKYTLYLNSKKYKDLYFVPYVGQSEFPPFGLCFIDQVQDTNDEREAAECGVSIEVYQKIKTDEEEQAKKTQAHQNWINSNVFDIRKIYPAFCLENELKNSTFKKLIEKEYNILDSYEFVHRNELFEKYTATNTVVTPEHSEDFYYSMLISFEGDALKEPLPLTTQQLIDKSLEMGVPVEIAREIIHEEHALVKKRIIQKKRDLHELAIQSANLTKKYPSFDLHFEYKYGSLIKTWYPLLSLEEAYELTYFKNLYTRKQPTYIEADEFDLNSARFCHKCGTKLIPGSVYCSNCGVKL